MALHVSVRFKCFVLLVWLRSVSAEIPMKASRPITKRGCADKCGNTSIPYPFGIGDGCFLEKSFELRCNNGLNIPKPTYGGFIVSNISILGSMTVDGSISTYCSGDQMHKLSYTTAAFLGKFTLSATKNKLTTVGCNTYAYVGLKTGCMSMCNSVQDSTNGSCTGIGCCQASVPAGLTEFNITVGRLNELRTNMEFNPCTYAFLVDENSFNFSSSYLKNFKNNGTGSVPVAIDWTVGNVTCEEAQRNSTSYACGDNTMCIQGIDAPGYLCKCLPGYEGNPYLNQSTGGSCQEIAVCPPGLHSYSTDGNFYCLPAYKHTSNINKIIVAATGLSVVIILLLGMGYWLYNRFQKRKQMKLKQEHFTRNGGLLLNQKITSNEGGVERAAKIFVAEELEKTTDNFNPSRIIGKGGFGTVFKGMLSNGEIVAIKKSTLVDETC